MDHFNSRNVTFAKADDGEWLLDRNWAENPPTPLEVESLLARVLLLDRILWTFVRHFAAGDIVTADDLDTPTWGDVMRFITAAMEAMTPPTVEPKEVHDAGD